MLCLVGRSGVGKTTLLERAVELLSARGVSVLACKSSHHQLSDGPGTDSHRLAQAGASGVALLSASGTHLYLDPPWGLAELLPLLAHRYQVALIEGGKGSPFPKVELLADRPPLLAQDQVVSYLQRGSTPTCDPAVEQLLDLLESKGQLLQPAKG